MRHYIIVKWKNAAKMSSCTAEIEALFSRTLTIEGIHKVTVHPSCSERPNRYDLMIEMEMDAAALPAYDASEPHRSWKEQYGGKMEKKAIFDCE